VQSLRQQIQQRATQSAQDFYGNSVGGIKSRIQNDRAQLESLAQQMGEGDAKAQIQEMIDSYNELESSMDQATQEQGVQRAVSQAAQQSTDGATRQAQEDETGESGDQTTERTVEEQGYITETTLNENGGVVDEGVVGNVADLPVEEEYIDEQGRIVSRARDDSGNAYELVTDDGGNMVEARAV
jgi:hypothetical protein